MSSPTFWVIDSGAEVHVGDVVIGTGGCRALITGVDPGLGWPELTYEDGDLRGRTLRLHPAYIQSKVR